MENMQVMTWPQMRQAIKEGRAKFLHYVGTQARPVYEVDGQIFEEAIRFDWSGDYEPRFYRVIPAEGCA